MSAQSWLASQVEVFLLCTYASGTGLVYGSHYIAVSNNFHSGTVLFPALLQMIWVTNNHKVQAGRNLRHYLHLRKLRRRGVKDYVVVSDKVQLKYGFSNSMPCSSH